MNGPLDLWWWLAGLPHWSAGFLLLGGCLRYRHLSVWCWVLAAECLLSLLLQAATGLGQFPDGTRCLSALRLTVHLLGSVAVVGLVLDLARQVVNLREATRPANPGSDVSLATSSPID